ncbi:MAG TPA: polymer-forming cytoskeletal protein [Burkholderiales bacterium]|nr:polymer-forming cytoskeletal protein [Burkholderiales bacterium]
MLNKQGLFGQNQNERYRRDGRGIEPTVTPTPAPAPEHRAEPPVRAEVEAPKPKIEETKGSKLIVGPDIKLKGAEITDCDTLVVEGRVEASMDTRVIQIAESGALQGSVGVDVAEIRGRFDGELTVRKQLIIHPGGKVSGKIRYGKIMIEDGGEITGDVSTLAAAKQQATVTQSKPAAQLANN